MELFETNRPKKFPLAVRMRPKSFDEFIGQRHLFDTGFLDKLIRLDTPPSMVIYGPPGTGKTTFALILARHLKMKFIYINAVMSNVKELRQILISAKNRFEAGRRTMLFVDEIHRFSSNQQEVMLPFIENGAVVFVGASIENPLFALVPAINSRCILIELKRLSLDDVLAGLRKAIVDDRGLGGKVYVEDDALLAIAKASDGDMRKAYAILELAVSGVEKVGLKDVSAVLQRKAVYYDRKSNQHYDTISSFIKAMRASDEDAALYWLSKMLYSGEDPRFIARRMVIFASEDIGLADSNALRVAVDCFYAINVIGMPEAEFNLTHACLYLCRAPKSREVKEIMDRNYDKIKNEITRTPKKFLDIPERGL